MYLKNFLTNYKNTVSKVEAHDSIKPVSIRFILYFLLTVILFFCSKHFIFSHSRPKDLLAYYALMLVLGLAGTKVSMHQAPPAYRIVLRACLLLFTFYWVFCYFSLPTDTAALTWLVGPLRWAIVGFGLLACFRPSFALLMFSYTLWFKDLMIRESGFNISPTDYTAVVEIGYFLSLGLLVHAGLNHFWADDNKLKKKNWQFLHLFLYLTVAIHFANYFYSGLEKVILGHSLTTWMMENHTEYLVLTAREYGILPISRLLVKLPFMYQIIASGTPFINAISLFSQLFTIIAIFRIRWMIALTILFDIFHVAIFVLTGIFFWKWVILNLSIVVGLRYFPQEKIQKTAVATGIVCMLSAPYVFFTAKLGWFDTRSPVISYVEAITKSNEYIRVPSNYFLMSSITFAQNRVIRPLIGHFQTGGFGIARSYTLMQEANACQLSAPAPHMITRTAMRRLQVFLEKHHKFILSRVDTRGYYNYDVYPHHIWSNPWEFSAFNALDKRDIIGYRIVAESACLDFKEGRFSKTIKYRSTQEINLK